MTLSPPVITLDGPSGTGKGTLSQLIAKKLGWHYLDSGLSFRLLAYTALQNNIDLQDEKALQHLAETLNLDSHNLPEEVRGETCASAASKIAVLPAVRQTLCDQQRRFRKWPGLVTDGRDMGTVIFPDASLKFFLHASIAERANRRVAQLKKRGMHATLPTILQDLEERDKRDQSRGVAPLKPAPDALLIDTTKLSVAESLNELTRYIDAFLSNSL